MTVVNVRPGETVTVIGLPAAPVQPPGPIDPGYSPPWAQVPGDPNAPRPSHPIMLPGMPGWGVPPAGGGGPVDPGYSPPWAQVRPPVDPGYSPPWAQLPEVPPTEPPPTLPPPTGGTGNWIWAWSPQLGRWVWVRVPGEGEAAPKA